MLLRTRKARSGPFEQLRRLHWGSLPAERMLMYQPGGLGPQVVRVGKRVGHATRSPILRLSQKLSLSRFRVRAALDQDGYGAVAAGLAKLLMRCRET